MQIGKAVGKKSFALNKENYKKNEIRQEKDYRGHSSENRKRKSNLQLVCLIEVSLP